MKTQRPLAVALAGLAWFATTMVAAGPVDPVAAAVHEFVRAGDTQNRTMLEGVLHPDLRIAVTTPDKPGVQILDKQTYLELVSAKKIGGDTRKVDVRSKEVSGNRAIVHVSLVGKSARFDSMQTFVREGERWQLLYELTSYEPKR